MLWKNGKRINHCCQDGMQLHNWGRVITGTRSVDNDFRLFAKLRESKLVVTVFLAEMITRTPDRDAAEVVTCAGRYHHGRKIHRDSWLGERYNVTLCTVHTRPAWKLISDHSHSTSFQAHRLTSYLFSKARHLNCREILRRCSEKSQPVFQMKATLHSDIHWVIIAGTSFNDFIAASAAEASWLVWITAWMICLPDSSYVTSSSFPARRVWQRALSLNNNGLRKNFCFPRSKCVCKPGAFKFNVGKVQIGNITAINWSNTFTRYDVKRELLTRMMRSTISLIRCITMGRPE